MDRGPLNLWNEWESQILVLFSLTLQVFLFLFAGIRRREASAVMRLLLWLAYLLADTTAIYAAGHLALSSTPRKHQLIAFWAPFLLLHLGGPDNITAYALEDSRLWLRHLQNLVVQVLGAAYVLYKHAAGGDGFILLASLLMFIAGVTKYAERTWALKCSNLDSIHSSLKKEPLSKRRHFNPPDHWSGLKGVQDYELLMRRAHSMFHICKRAIVDSWIEEDQEHHTVEMLRPLREDYKVTWTLMEMELSLMFDLLYTKAGVIHNWSGYCIRFVSSLAAATSIVLFQFSDKGGSIVDVAVTYTLLAGAFLLETISLLIALGSTWTYAFLCSTRWSWLQHTALCNGRWDRLRRLVQKITGRGGSGSSVRRWSGKVGQYNMLHCYSRSDKATFRPLLGKLARMLRYKEWWIRYHYSGTINLSDDMKQTFFKYIVELTKGGKSVNLQGLIRGNWGEVALGKDSELYNDFVKKKYLGIEFQEAIIIWHIGTDVFIKRSIPKNADAAKTNLVKDIRMLSNYMMFLLVNRPYMLPGLAQSMLYRRTCQNLAELPKKTKQDPPNWNICAKLKKLFALHDGPDVTGLMHVEDLANTIYEETIKLTVAAPRLPIAKELGETLCKLANKEPTMAVLELLRKLWIDFLVYAANRCSREFHAKKLSNGGELTTILWLMTDYLHQEGYVLGP